MHTQSYFKQQQQQHIRLLTAYTSVWGFLKHFHCKRDQVLFREGLCSILWGNELSLRQLNEVNALEIIQSIAIKDENKNNKNKSLPCELFKHAKPHGTSQTSVCLRPSSNVAFLSRRIQCK